MIGGSDLQDEIDEMIREADTNKDGVVDFSGEEKETAMHAVDLYA